MIFGVTFGLTGAILIELLGEPVSWLIIRLAYLSFAGLIGGIFLGLMGNRQGLGNDIRTTEALSWSWGKSAITALLGLGSGAIVGSIFWLFIGRIARIPNLVHDSLLFGLVIGLIGGTIGLVFGGLSTRVLDTKTTPNQGIRLSLKNAVFTGILSAMVFGILFGWSLGLGIGLVAALWYGGLDALKHYILRLILFFRNHIPINYPRFLDYAADRIFLQKVGGGYIFIHRLLLEHFASLTEENIERVTQDHPQGRQPA